MVRTSNLRGLHTVNKIDNIPEIVNHIDHVVLRLMGSSIVLSHSNGSDLTVKDGCRLWVVLVNFVISQAFVVAATCLRRCLLSKENQRNERLYSILLVGNQTRAT